MLEELQQMEACLNDWIDGHCGGLEHRMEEVKQWTEECLVLLEMACMEMEMGHADLSKQFNSLKLEVNRLNRFIEWEMLAHQQGQLGIFTAVEHNSMEGGIGPRMDPRHCGPKFGSNFPHSQAPVQDTSHSRSHRAVDVGGHSHGGGSRQSDSSAELLKAQQVRLPKIQFPVFSGDDPQLWRLRCENYFDMYGVESSLWVRVATMHLEGTVTRWLQSSERRVK
jgi:hypothetical protein